MLSNISIAQETEQVDPFYRKLYEEGKYFYENKKLAEAIADFEIAFFGYLDNLPQLLECYIYLTDCHFQIKNYERAKYYIDEIKKLKLEEYINETTLTEELKKKYQEIIVKFSKTPPK
jgi:tetratricopeptide (TPR) repeat protein